MEDKLAKMQKECNELFADEGLTDRVLDMQIEINQLRHKHDISDENEKVHEDFVQ